MLVLRWPRWARRGERRGWGAPSLSLSSLEESLTAAVSGFRIDNYRRSPRADPAVLSRDSSASSWRRTCAAVPACITHARKRRSEGGGSRSGDGYRATGTDGERGGRRRLQFLRGIRGHGLGAGGRREGERDFFVRDSELRMQPWMGWWTGDSGGGQIGKERRKGAMRQPWIASGVSRVVTWGNVCPLFRFGAVLTFGTDKRRYSVLCGLWALICRHSRDSLLQLQVTSF
jgi:hypothetical protein